MKGNMFLGYARGSVGDVTFARTKGQQVARARNRQPSNPRTISQSMQRSLFANAVKFHSKGVQQLFKFAFEDKRAAESDYNAFMRHNINSSIRISKYASESALFPALGKWMMSYGSLRSVDLTCGTGSADNIWVFTAPSATSNMTTFGDLSMVLRQDYGLMEGDIVTLVHIVAVGCTSSNMPSIYEPIGSQPADWNLYQFKIDSSTSQQTGEVVQFDNGTIRFNHAGGATSTYIQGFAVIFSRPRSNGLLVSTSYLVGNSAFNQVFEAAQDSAYIEQVLASWQTSEQAILQGSLVKQPEEVKSIVSSVNPSLPTNAGTVVVNLTRSDFYASINDGTLVGELVVDGELCDLVAAHTGSTISFEVSDYPITGEGMRSYGNKITLTNQGGNNIQKIVVYDM